MQTVAEMLRGERERQGLTLKDIETATNIRVLYLQAIEDGNYSLLPGEVYVKGFIRNYANALGLNGAEYVELYRKQLQPDEPVPTAVEEEAPPQPQEALTTRSAALRRRQRSRQTEIWIIGLLLLAVAGGFCWYAFSAEDAQQPLTLPQAQQPAPVVPSVPTLPEQPAAPAAPAKLADKRVIVVANFISRSWVQVTVDGKTLYEGIPQTGEVLTWQAEQPITLKVGNAGAVELTHNNRPLGKLGGNGEVVLRTFSADGQQ